MLKRFVFTIISLCLAVVVFFIMGEVCFRIFRGPPNPSEAVVQKETKSLLKPNFSRQEKSSVEGEFDYQANSNSFGYRGKEFKMPKEKGKLRIMALGDSMTYGVGAADDQTIPAYLEKQLLAQGIPAEVINAGIGHAGTIKHYINLKNFHLDYNPDVVLLFFDLTDMMDDWYMERHAVYGDDGEINGMHPLYINGKRDWWLTSTYYSAFCRYIHDKIVRSVEKWQILGTKKYLNRKKSGQRAKAMIINSDTISDEKILQFDYLLLMRGEKRKELIYKQFERTAKYLIKIRDYLKERDIPFVLVMYPHGIYVGEKEWNDGRETWGFEKDKLYTDHYPFQLMESFTRQNDIAYINSLDDFLRDKKQNNRELFYNWDGHMKPEGYKIVADGVYDDLVFQRILNGSLGKMLKQAF